MPSNGIAVTGAGNLPCRRIIHINARLDLTTIIANVLVKAEQLCIRSVAFPALGTGEFIHFFNLLGDKIVSTVTFVFIQTLLS